MSFKTAGDDLSRCYSRSWIKLELENRPGFVLQIVGVRTLALTVSQLVAEPVYHRAGATYGSRSPRDESVRYGARGYGCIGRQIAFTRHHHRKLGREFEVPRTTQLLHQTGTQLGRAFIGVAPVRTQECSFEDVRQGARSIERPILSAFEEDVRLIAGGKVRTLRKPVAVAARCCGCWRRCGCPRG